LSHPTDFLGLPVVSSWEPSGFARTVFAGRVKSRQANDREWLPAHGPWRNKSGTLRSVHTAFGDIGIE